MEITVVDDKVFGKIEFITPTSWSFPTSISWKGLKGEENELAILHTKQVTSETIEFNWEDKTLLEKVQPHIRPYKRTKAGENNLGFNVEYFYLLIPDVQFEIFFKENPTKKTLLDFNGLLSSFENDWNAAKKRKQIEYISKITLEGNHYSIVMDIGLNNSIRMLNKLIEALDQSFGGLIEKIRVKKFVIIFR